MKKKILIELDDRCARDLERVAPAKKRMRVEFIRHAVQHAIDVALDRATERAYRSQPLEERPSGLDVTGWDPDNVLRRPAEKPRRAPRSARRKAA